MKQTFRRYAIIGAGWGFILLGILGIFLPILQGILFLLVGLYLLSTQYVWARNLLHKVKDRFPKISRKFDEAKAKAREVQLNIAKRVARAPQK